MEKKIKIVFFVGTRPEAIKVAPIISEIKKHNDIVDSILCITGQHREMLRQALDDFDLAPDFDLDVMQPNQTLTLLCSNLFKSIGCFLDHHKPDWVVSQGDTSTVLASSLCSFFQSTKFAHVEAGLRSFNKFAPFPEEINRRVASLVANIHFAPTELAKNNLLSEGIPPDDIIVTGNTVVDALNWMLAVVRADPPKLDHTVENIMEKKLPIVLITGHRRENFGSNFENICLAIKDLSLMYPNVHFVYPVHMNPNVKNIVFNMLGSLENVNLTEPLRYKEFVRLMDYADFILTDSGGVQEEGPSLGKRVLVMRDVTERQEGVDSGLCHLIGTNKQRIVDEVSSIIRSKNSIKKSMSIVSPYGDGHASKRIVDALIDISIAGLR